MKRIEQIRAWLFPMAALVAVFSLLFSLAAPPATLLYSFGVATLLSVILWYVSVARSGGRQRRNLLLRAEALLQQAKQHPGNIKIQQQKEHLQESLASDSGLEASIQALEEALPQEPSHQLRELLALLLLSFIAAIVLKTFFVEPFHIPSASMFPTLHVGDHIFVNKFIYGIPIPGTKTKLFSGWSLPRRGDVIVFQHDKDTDYIKRVVALPGDVVDVTMDKLSINGFDLPREYLGELSWRELDSMTNLNEPRESNRFIEDNNGRSYEIIYDNPPNIMPSRHLVVPPGEYMVLGDNRDHSFDSLHWGFVPLEKIQGRAMFVVGALEDGKFRWDRLGTPIW